MSDAAHSPTDHPDRLIKRGGEPGRYFNYRPGEVLVIGATPGEVGAIVGKATDRELGGDERSRQRAQKRKRHQTPFDVWLYAFEERPGRSAKEVIDSLRSHKIGAHYNYVSSRTPMRSHAVSYAEPNDVRAIDPALEPLPSNEPKLIVGVLDTGRPRPDGDAAATRGVDAELAVAEIDDIFVPYARSRNPLEPEPDRDTMVKDDGTLSHPHAGHGLFVASIIARHAAGVRIRAEATMYQDSIADLFEILIDLEDAVQHGCKLLNMSLGFRTHDDHCPRALDVALASLEKNDVLLVASAGNDGTERAMWPAADDRVVAVAATDRNGTPTDWSNYGAWVDACAFGDDVDSHYPYGRWIFPNGTAKEFDGAARWSGTSFAAPLVTALIANKVRKGVSPRAAWNDVRANGQPVKEYGVFLQP